MNFVFIALNIFNEHSFWRDQLFISKLLKMIVFEPHLFP